MQAPAGAPRRRSGAPAYPETTLRARLAEPGRRTDRASEGEVRTQPTTTRPRVLKAAFPMQPKGGCTGPGGPPRPDFPFLCPKGTRSICGGPRRTAGTPAAPGPRLRYRAAAGPAQRVLTLGLSQVSTTHKRGNFVTQLRKEKRRSSTGKPPFPYPGPTTALLRCLQQSGSAVIVRLPVGSVQLPAGTLTGMAARAGIAPALMIPHPHARP